MDEALTRIKEKLHDTFPDLSAEELAITVLLHQARIKTLKMDNTQYETRIFNREWEKFQIADMENAGYMRYQVQDTRRIKDVLHKDRAACISAFIEVYAHQAVGKRKDWILEAVHADTLTEKSVQAFAKNYSHEIQKLLRFHKNCCVSRKIDWRKLLLIKPAVKLLHLLSSSIPNCA